MRVTQGVVTPNIVKPIEGLPSSLRDTRSGHAGDSERRVAKDDAADAVEPGEIGDRRRHRNVGDIDIGADVAGGERRDHQFRQPDRQGAHAPRYDRSAAAAADPDDRVKRFGRHDKALERRAHRRDSFAPVAAVQERLRGVSHNLMARDVDCASRLADSDVDDCRRRAGRRRSWMQDMRVPRPWCPPFRRPERASSPNHPRQLGAAYCGTLSHWPEPADRRTASVMRSVASASRNVGLAAFPAPRASRKSAAWCTNVCS